LEAANFDGDEEPSSHHVGAFLSNGENIGCASIVREAMNGETGWRLRGMAVRADKQSSGIGGQLLRELERIVQLENQGRLLWCNARTPAVEFYERAGWIVVGEEFEIPT